MRISSSRLKFRVQIMLKVTLSIFILNKVFSPGVYICQPRRLSVFIFIRFILRIGINSIYNWVSGLVVPFFVVPFLFHLRFFHLLVGQISSGLRENHITFYFCLIYFFNNRVLNSKHLCLKIV